MIKNYKESVSYLFMFLFLVGAFTLHLMTSVMAGLIIFILVKQIYIKINPLDTHSREVIQSALKEEKCANNPEIRKKVLKSRITLLIVVLSVVVLLGSIFMGAYYAFKLGNGNLKQLSETIYNVAQQIRLYVPASIAVYIPDNFNDMQAGLLAFFKTNSFHLFQMTETSVRVLVHVLLGLFIGAVIAFHFLEPTVVKEEDKSKLTYYLQQRLANLGEIFKKVASAQLKISFINTCLTAIYLLVINPLFNLNIPYGKSLVFLTFLFGLMPIIGNLLTNSAIVLISLTVSFPLAIASLVFLVVVHKLEYYVNAKIVGKNITSSIWEILVAMVVMETLFGIMGVIMAPVIYGYIKEELKIKQLI